MADLTFRLFGKDVSLSKAMDKGADAVKGLGKSMEGLSPVAGAAGAAAAGALATGLLANLDVEASNDKLAAQLGASGQYAKELGGIAGSLYANAYGENIGEVNNALRAVLQDGVLPEDATNAQIESITGQVMSLAQTFEQDLGGTTRAVSQMIRTGLAKNADEALDIVTRGFQQGANKADDLLDTLNEYGTQFRKVGLSGKTATGLLVQGLRAGARDADIVADAIKEFSIRAVDGSELTAQGFKALGLSGKRMAADIGAGGPKAAAALDLTLDRLRGIEDPVKRSQAAVALFGTQAEDLGDALFALDPSQAAERLGKVGDAAEKLDKTIGDNAQTTLTKFKRQLQQTFTEGAASVVKFGMENQAVVVPLLGVLGSLAAVILAVGAATRAWAAIQAVIKAATVAWTAVQWALNSALFANPIGLIVLAIVALVAAIVLAWNKSETFRNVVLGVWNAVKAGAAALWGGIKAAWDGIVAATSKVTGWIKRAFGSVAGFFKKWWPLLVVVFTTQLAIVIGLWNRFGSRIVAGVKRYFGIVRTVISTALRVALAIARTVWSGIRTALINPVMSGVSVLTRWIGRVAGIVGGGIRRALSAARQAAAPFLSVGRAIIDGIIRGVRNGVGALAGAVKNAAKAALDGAKAFLGIKSPSKVFELQVGKQIAAGATVGIERAAPGVEHAAARMSSGLTSAARSSIPAQRGPITSGAPVVINVMHPLTPQQVWGTVTNAAERVPAGSARLPRRAVATR